MRAVGIKKTPGDALACVCLAPRQLVWRERTFDELARISHQPSAASPYLAPSQGLLLGDVLDVLPSTPASIARQEALDLTPSTTSRDEPR